jgi:hypothetical protein
MNISALPLPIDTASLVQTRSQYVLTTLEVSKLSFLVYCCVQNAVSTVVVTAGCEMGGHICKDAVNAAIYCQVLCRHENPLHFYS